MLKKAIKKIQTKTTAPNLSAQLASVLQTKTSKEEQRLSVSTSKGVHFIPLSDIISIEGDGNSTRLNLIDRQNVNSSKNLKFFEKALIPSEFMRVHQSHIVNVSHIRQLLNEDGFWVVTHNDKRIPVARRQKDPLVELLKKRFGRD